MASKGGARPGAGRPQKNTVEPNSIDKSSIDKLKKDFDFTCYIEKMQVFPTFCAICCEKKKPCRLHMLCGVCESSDKKNNNKTVI